MSAADPVWVDSDAALREAVARLRDAPALAVDTEADSFYHYFHKCCLLQVSDGAVAFLIDPLALRRLEPLGEVLSDARALKVLHAAEQDVLYLRRDYGFHLAPLFDTMIAAQLIGKRSIGLAGLLEEHLGVTLDKACQRDDWSRRPLSDRQRTYAAEDVRHIIRLAEFLRAGLAERGRLDWAEEEFALVARRAWEPRPFSPDDFWGLKGSRDLTPRQAAILRELYVMRDERARQADVPPFRIVSDEALLVLARRAPRDPEGLDGVRGVTRLVRKRIGGSVLEATRRALDLPEADLPVPPRNRGRRRTPAMQQRLERLRAWRRDRAEALALDPGVLFPLATLEALAAGGVEALKAPEAIPGLRAWRLRLIAPEAQALLA